MDISSESQTINSKVSFHGGAIGALLPFIFFVVGVITIALSGAPDEKGFWPVLIFALGLGLILSKNKTAFSEAVIEGMSQKIVMIMITAWILASIIGVLMIKTGFVEALMWMSGLVDLGSIGYVLSAFVICCVVSLSTGSSFATILICGPLLYPAGGLMGAHLPTLAGAIIGGATFGDFTAPISDTTIASALSQKAEIGPTVRSRLKYIIPVLVLAFIAFYLSALLQSDVSGSHASEINGNARGMPMLLVPILIIWLFLKGRHLVHGLLLGLLFGVVLGWATGLLPAIEILSLDIENFAAKSFVIDGINRAVGISFFTILLMGLVGTIRASGLMDQWVEIAERRTQNKRQAETWIAGSVWAAVMLTTHSIVAILMVSDFASRTGENVGISSIRRANILSLVVCVFPFLLPYFIPVILMANTTTTGQEYDVASVSPLMTGMHNFVAWGLLLVVLVSLIFGYGRKDDEQA